MENLLLSRTQRLFWFYDSQAPRMFQHFLADFNAQSGIL